VTLTDTLRAEAATLQPDLAALRRRIHRRPETGLSLPDTQAAVLEALAGLPLEITPGRSSTSVTAVLRGARPGPAVLLRADMDALPVTEATGLDYASTVAGVMHACGHDLHVAMLAGAARLLSAHRDRLDGDVVFMFQPGEEGFGGAAHMIDEGVLTASGQTVSSAYGIHVSANRRAGVFASRPGPLMAATHSLRVTVRGVGGHASMPHLSRDPITVAAELVTGLQTLVTRRFDAFDPVVVTVGIFQAGTKINTIPDLARFEASARTFSQASAARLREESTQLCESIAAAYGLTAEVEFTDDFPVTVNDPAQYEFAAGVIADVLGPGRIREMEFPLAASEDFSLVLDRVPGCFLHLGAAPPSAGDNPPPNHSAQAVFDDSVASDGALIHAELAVRALHRAANG
jgi:amidohydrolase